MGWAARSKKTPGVNPHTESYKKRGKYSLSAKEYQLTQTMKWDSTQKRMVPTGKNPQVERRSFKTIVIDEMSEVPQKLFLGGKPNV